MIFAFGSPVPALSPFKVRPPTLSNSVYVILEPSLSISHLFLLSESKRKEETTTNQEDAAEEKKSHKTTTNQEHEGEEKKITQENEKTQTITPKITTDLEDAVLIVGGYGYNLETSDGHSEVFFPRTGKGCTVPEYDYPGGVLDVTLSTIGQQTLLCGGRRDQSDCQEFTPGNTTAWTKYADLIIDRHAHTTWESSQGLVLIGGNQRHKTTAELVNVGIMNFSLPYIMHFLNINIVSYNFHFSDPCAITDTETDSFILTGGYQTRTARKNVSRYKQNVGYFCTF